MAKAGKTPRKTGKQAAKLPLGRRIRRLLWRGFLFVVLFVLGMTLLYTVVNPRATPYLLAESRRLGGVEREWVNLDQIAPVMARAAVAAEDANFCLHWGLDVAAIEAALEDGGGRGASTISQQVVKNVYLWHGRSWARKAAEALWTPLVEAVWTKQRIVEVYLNVAEFDEGVFGVEAAAEHYFGVAALDLSGTQAARLAAILPDPKGRSAANPSDFVRRRAASILDGAATIDADGRADCFQR